MGMEINQHFAWGIRGDVPTHPHTTFFCVGMRGEMCGVDMRGCVRQGCRSGPSIGRKFRLQHLCNEWSKRNTFNGFGDGSKC